MAATNHPKGERTLVVIKPDGIHRSLIGDLIRRYEQTGLKLVGLKMLVPSPDLIERHYTVDPAWRVVTGQKTIDSYRKKGKTPPSEDPREITEIILKNLKKYLSSSPVVAMVWEGMNAVGIVRKITGSTEPLQSDMGTIRGDYTIDSYEVADVDSRAIRNLIHASGSVEEAEKEIAIWFDPTELIKYRHVQEAILYDVNLDGILE